METPMKHLLFLLVLVLFGSMPCFAGITSKFVRKTEASVDMPMDSDVFSIPQGYNAPQQVHIAQGDHVGRGVIVSWVTPSEPGSNTVLYGTEKSKYGYSAEGIVTSYKFYNYTSDYIHHCVLKKLKGKMEATKRSGKATQMKQDQTTKRSKVKSANCISIEELNARKTGNTFQGDVLVVYKVNLDKVNKTREVLRADLTDIKAEMTITLNINGSLVQQHEEKIVPGMGISITDFNIAPRTDYDRGDSDCVLILKDTSTIETIGRICNEYNFIPSTTIKQLFNNTGEFPIRTIGALVVGAKKMGSISTLEIKDGHTEEDRAQLEIHPSLAHHYIAVEEQLQRNDTPALLFRNIVKKLDKRNTFRTGLSTYICKLNDKRTLQILKELLQKTYEVHGILKVENPFSSPFSAFYSQCNYKFDGYGILEEDSGHCAKCDQDVNYVHKLHLKTVLTTQNKQTIHCSIDHSVIQHLMPALANIKYEEYLQDKSKVVFILRDTAIKGCFTMTQNNAITNAIVVHTDGTGDKETVQR